MSFDFEYNKSYYRSFNYFINKLYKKHAYLYNAIDKKLVLKINIYFYLKYRNLYIKLFINDFNYFYNIIEIAIEII